MQEHQENQYLNLLRKILDEGIKSDDRTGTGTISIFGATMTYDLSKGEFPLLTTKKVHWKAIVEELLWFISGSTNAKKLSEKGIKIWDGHGSRKYLDSIGLKDNKEGDIGPGYAFQWRHSGATYKDCDTDYSGQGFDQLQMIIDEIKRNPTSRRIVMNSWNVRDLPLMALPPCHMFCQFRVINGELHCQMYQRSADMGLGVPFNIASYSLLTLLIASICDLKPGKFIHVLGDAHIYLNHIEGIKLQLERKPLPFPSIKIKKREKIDDFISSDIELINYNPHPFIPLQMSL